MSSRDYGFLTLRNTVAYQSNGDSVPANNILITSSNGIAVFSDIVNISTINISTLNTGNFNVSTFNTSTVNANTVNVNKLTAISLNTSTVNANIISTNSFIIINFTSI